ncbi:dihydrofolate reductase family protein [Leucobacter tenebrionis]|uniref:dihydrofolate reductase family protein n=1 Tax=Leucobacter tenebrionis TaxID=2873270 RepID=UPI001CA7B1E9|nr:dihydrofolate reductase family protein [Leucobacter tenebrionis]QZY52390.1 dihydrofolate reductase family protein [Leucobacter tenebrionis]
MSRLIVSAWVTLDGYVAGADDSMDWLRGDADLAAYEMDLVEGAGVLLLGRKTHEDFASYWPKVAGGELEADEANRQYARRLDQLEKIVASRTGRIASWPRSRCIQEVSEAEIRRVKVSADGDVVVYGSLSLVGALNELRAIDEFHLIVHPVLLCRGKPLLGEDQPRADLGLIECKPFSSGAVLLKYGTAG